MTHKARLFISAATVMIITATTTAATTTAAPTTAAVTTAAATASTAVGTVIDVMVTITIDMNALSSLRPAI